MILDYIIVQVGIYVYDFVYSTSDKVENTFHCLLSQKLNVDWIISVEYFLLTTLLCKPIKTGAL